LCAGVDRSFEAIRNVPQVDQVFVVLGYGTYAFDRSDKQMRLIHLVDPVTDKDTLRLFQVIIGIQNPDDLRNGTTARVWNERLARTN
jgi:hypothetical protein